MGFDRDNNTATQDDRELVIEKDDDFVMISALEHYSYCPRQCALIHLEQTFDENVYTVRGRFLHERVDEPFSTMEDGIQVERAIPLWSETLGLRGKADVVEFHGEVPYPVEYKLGKQKRGRFRQAADIQLCAQALCLEEMLHRDVPEGAVFHRGSQRRRKVMFTTELRERTTETIRQVRILLQSALFPSPVNDERCPNCSLINSCVPILADTGSSRKQAQSLFILDKS